MHITLHLTTDCNLNCDYCYAPPFKSKGMSEEIAKKAVDFGSNLSPSNTGIIFFGGEPLLKKDIIKSTIDYCNELKKSKGYQFHFKVTTNGILLDKNFLEYAVDAKLSVSLSVDGVEQAHNYHRKTSTNKGSFDITNSKIDLLLKYQPYANFMMVISPETVKYYADSVEYLFSKGVRYIIASINYAGNWSDKALNVLKNQYRLLSKTYERKILNNEKFYFSPFEIKFASHINTNYKLCELCHLGTRQISISSDGEIYPCIQFIRNKNYCIGNVWNGFDYGKKLELNNSNIFNTECNECTISDRCNNSCSCLNYQTTGTINSISPILCETERIITPIVDKLGEKLFRMKAPLFIQKHYNAAYPVLSLVEDLF